LAVGKGVEREIGNIRKLELEEKWRLGLDLERVPAYQTSLSLD